MTSSAERMQKKRTKDARAAKLAELGFTEGERPSDAVRAKVRAAVLAGELDVPAEGFDDGTRWAWRPGATKAPNPVLAQAARELRARRVEVAEREGVAIGWVGPDLAVGENAPRQKAA